MQYDIRYILSTAKSRIFPPEHLVSMLSSRCDRYLGGAEGLAIPHHQQVCEDDSTVWCHRLWPRSGQMKAVVCVPTMSNVDSQQARAASSAKVCLALKAIQGLPDKYMVQTCFAYINQLKHVLESCF